MEAAGLVFIPKTGCGVGVRLQEPGLMKKTKSLKSQQTTEVTGWPRGCAFPSCGCDPNSRTRSVAFRLHLTMLFLPKPDQPGLVGGDNEVAA
jgi:hypothetical protein